MPQIRAYQQQLQSDASIPAQQASGSDFGGPGVTNLGRAVQSAGQDIGYLQKQVEADRERQAVSDIHVKLSQANAVFAQKAAEIELNAKPGQRDLGHSFFYGAEGTSDQPEHDSFKFWGDEVREKLQDGHTAYTRQVFDQGIANLSEKYALHFASAQSRLDGHYVAQQHKSLSDSLQAVVLNDTTAEAVQESLAAFDSAIDDPKGIYARVDIAQREKFKQIGHSEIAESHLIGLIQHLKPDVALRKLENGWGRDLLTGEKQAVLRDRAEREINAQFRQARLMEQRAEHDHKVAIDQKIGKNLLQIQTHFLSPPGAERPPLPDLTARNPDMHDIATTDNAGYISLSHFAKSALDAASNTKGDESFYTRTLLPNILRGKYATPLEVLDAGAGRLDRTLATSALEQFKTWKDSLAAPIKQEHGVGESHIRKTFAIPQGALINPPGVNEAGTRALDRFNTWYSSLLDRSRTEGPKVFDGVDVQAKAREIADEEHLSLVNEIISTIPRLEKNLPYKTTGEIEDALRAGKITVREYNRALADLHYFQQAKEMVDSQPRRSSSSKSGRKGKD